jgi:hypothetical protein
MSKRWSATEDEKHVGKPDWGARPQRSIKDELYYVSCSSISCSGRGNDGRRIEFRKCRRTKAKRTVIVLAFLVLLDLALSMAAPVYGILVHCVFISVLCLYLILSLVLSVYKGRQTARCGIILCIEALPVSTQRRCWWSEDWVFTPAPPAGPASLPPCSYHTPSLVTSSLTKVSRCAEWCST